MLNYIRKSWVKVLIFSYLILAILGSFSFSISESYCYESFNKESSKVNSYIYSTSYTIDWIAEDTNTIVKTKIQRNSNFRIGLLREFVITGTVIASMRFLVSYYRTLENNYIPIIKNQILLKLRI
jgi:hypothetical protein